MLAVQHQAGGGPFRENPLARTRRAEYKFAMPVRPEDHAVFRRIGEAESDRRAAPASFREAVAILDRLIGRRRTVFPDRRFEPTEEEFHAHEALYARARALATYRS